MASAQADEDLRQRFQETLRRLMQNTLQTFWQQVRELGFSMTQVFALRYIYRRGTCNISDLAKALGVTNAAASQMLGKLVSQGYVLREENPEDRRNKRLSLTPAGERVLQRLTPSWQAAFDDLMSRSTPEEMAQIVAAFELLLSKFPPPEGTSHTHGISD